MGNRKKSKIKVLKNEVSSQYDWTLKNESWERSGGIRNND